MIYRYLVLFFLIPGALFAQRPHSKAQPKFMLPKVGTMFVNTYYATDSSGALVAKSVADPGIDDDTLYIVQSGVRLLGRPNCVMLLAKSHPDTTVISYATNGDLYLWSMGHDTEWEHLPFGLKTGKKILQHFRADSGSILAKGYYMPHNRTLEVFGHDTITVGGKVYECIKLLVDDIRLYEGQNWEQGSRFWYAPELGYFAKMNMGWNGPYFLNQQLKIWEPGGEASR